MAALCKQSCKQILISVSLFFFVTPNSAKVVLSALKKGFVAFSQSLKLCLIYFFTSRLFSRWYYTSKLLVLMFADGAMEERL